MNSDYSVPLIIRALGRGKKGTRNLTLEESHFIMKAILNDNVTGPQLGAFLMLMRVKEETADEIAGMVSAAHDHLTLKVSTQVDVTWPAYAGKKKQPSWYVLAAKLLSQNGVRIFMHGGGEHTEGRQYARQVCEAVRLPVASSLAEAEELLNTRGFAYLSLDRFYPSLSNIIDMKAELGLRSPVNTLVRHLTPFPTKLTLQGMFHPAYMPLHHDSAIALGQNNNIVCKGDGGEFEVRPDSETKVAIHSNKPVFKTTVPPELSSRSVRPETVSMDPLLKLWEGIETNPYGEAAVVQTAALVLAQLKSRSFSEALTQVLTWWANRT